MWMEAVHRWIKLDPQDPATTEQPWGLSGTPTYGAINTVGIFLLAACLLLCLFRRHPVRREEWLLLGCLVTSLLLLSTFSKFHIQLGRYALLILYLATAWAALVLSARVRPWFHFLLCSGSVLWGIFMLPFVLSMVTQTWDVRSWDVRSVLFDRRSWQIRNVSPAMLADYRAIADYIKVTGVSRVGIEHHTGNEYAMWCELRRACGFGLQVQDSRPQSPLVSAEAWRRVKHQPGKPEAVIVLARREKRATLDPPPSVAGKTTLSLGYGEVLLPVCTNMPRPLPAGGL